MCSLNVDVVYYVLLCCYWFLKKREKIGSAWWRCACCSTEHPGEHAAGRPLAPGGPGRRGNAGMLKQISKRLLMFQWIRLRCAQRTYRSSWVFVCASSHEFGLDRPGCNFITSWQILILLCTIVNPDLMRWILFIPQSPGRFQCYCKADIVCVFFSATFVYILLMRHPGFRVGCYRCRYLPPVEWSRTRAPCSTLYTGTWRRTTSPRTSPGCTSLSG